MSLPNFQEELEGFHSSIFLYLFNNNFLTPKFLIKPFLHQGEAEFSSQVQKLSEDEEDFELI
jgi:hypothetical protein